MSTALGHHAVETGPDPSEILAIICRGYIRDWKVRRRIDRRERRHTRAIAQVETATEEPPCPGEVGAPELRAVQMMLFH